MKNPSSAFPPLTRRQRDLLEELKKEIEDLAALHPGDPDIVKIQKRIDELSVKVLRFALKPLPAEIRSPGFFLEAHYEGGRLRYVDKEIKPGFGIFHPDLPPWAKDHLVEWIRMLKLRREDARAVLRETSIVGIETGVKLPEDFAEIELLELIKRRVLELRGVKDEDFGDGEDMTAHLITNQKKRKRTRKDHTSWDYVIDKLVEEGLLPKKITPQAFRKMLEGHHPDYPWDRV